MTAGGSSGCGDSSTRSSQSASTVPGEGQPANTFPVGAPITLGDLQMTVEESGPDDGGYEVEIDIANLANEPQQLTGALFEFRPTITASPAALVRSTDLETPLGVGEVRDASLVYATDGDPPEAVRICLGGPMDREDCDEALRLIADTLTHPQHPHATLG